MDIRRSRNALSCIAGLCLLACVDDIPLGERHPSRDRILGPAVVATATLPLAGEQLAVPAGATLLRLGVLDHPASHSFGRVQDAVRLPSPATVVLDGHAKGFRVFTDTGELQGDYGRPGLGPGEYLYPERIAVRDPADLLVFDRDGRVSIYQWSGAVLYYQMSINTRVEIWDACVADTLMVIHGRMPANNDLLHIYSAEGVYLSSFGEVYDTDNAIVRFQLAQGRIACADDLVLFAPSSLPDLRAYSVGGSVKWRIDIENFNTIDIFEVGTGSALRVPEKGYNGTYSLVASPDRRQALWQIEHVVRVERKSERMSLHTYIVDMNTGSVEYLGSDLDRVYYWDGANIVVGSSNPYPFIEIKEFGS